MHKSRESIDKQQAAQMGYDPLLATAALSGCEIVKCQHYKDGKCNDPNEYVNKQGENVCGRREDAILYEDYLEMINDNPQQFKTKHHDNCSRNKKKIRKS